MSINNIIKGRIIKCIGGFYTVFDGERNYVIKARGIFRERNITPMAGDYVEFSKPGKEGGGSILEVFERKNVLERPMVANIDLLLITLCPVSPKPDLQLVDILLINTNIMKINVCLIINKCDLDIDEAKNIADKFSHLDNIIIMSAKDEIGMDELKDLCRNKTVCFAGQSGVGKSSILNVLIPNINAKVDEMSRKTKRGRHTTRQTSLIAFNGGFIVDSPGFSMLELKLMDPIKLKEYYPDFLEHAAGCRYLSCMHNTEPDCTVIQAVINGKLDNDRHTRYKRLMNDMNERWKRRYD